ncbi:MAG: hypothetical protein ABW092_20480, partial [Candidatus Thiodiazotropha sp.]
KNLFRNTTHADTNDLIGVSITPVETAEEQPYETHNNKVLHNEMVNMGIGVGITDDVAVWCNPEIEECLHDESNCCSAINCCGSYTPTGFVDNTLIAHNDIYVEAGYIESLNDGSRGCIENAFDIKIGASDSQHPVVIRDNNVWGYRKVGNCGGSGEAFNIQKFAKNIAIERNLVFDQERGLRLEGYGCCVADEYITDRPTRHVRVEDNLFYNIDNYSDSEHSGNVFIAATDGHAENNYVSHGHRLVSIIGAARYNVLNNQIMNMSNFPGPAYCMDSPANLCRSNNCSYTEDCMIDYRFTIKQITNPQPFVLVNALKKQIPPVVIEQ